MSNIVCLDTFRNSLENKNPTGAIDEYLENKNPTGAIDEYLENIPPDYIAENDTKVEFLVNNEVSEYYRVSFWFLLISLFRDHEKIDDILDGMKDFMTSIDKDIKNKVYSGSNINLSGVFYSCDYRLKSIKNFKTKYNKLSKKYIMDGLSYLYDKGVFRIPSHVCFEDYLAQKHKEIFEKKRHKVPAYKKNVHSIPNTSQ
ncbi:hypothetical protein MK079_02395 [Candidatus Gracilibacteria bacterium]|nr:hypothetical protein [Candidatus Gracilibacteria bacterium]